MRIVLAVALVAGPSGCMIDGPHGGPGPGHDDGWGSGYGGGGGYTEYGCTSDAACGGGLVCARTHECLDPSQVRAVRTTWTMKGATPSVTTCAAAPDLAITFSNASLEQFGFAPVPCEAGKFTVDKLPLRYTTVMLGRAQDDGSGVPATIDAAGNALIDLPF